MPPLRQIRADFDADTIVVYQAYSLESGPDRAPGRGRDPVRSR